MAQTNVAGSYGYGTVHDRRERGVGRTRRSTAHNEFVEGTTYTDTFDGVECDGTTTTVAVNIVGTNDAAG